MSNLVNFIQIDETTNTITGNIATLTFDIDITGEAFTSEHPRAPVYRLFAMTPRNRRIEVGAVWKNRNRQDHDYYSLSVNTGHGRLNYNLGRYPGQDDETLMAVIPWD